MTRGDTGRLPDFVGIGAMKAASGWLYRCLIAHPEVVGPRRKELHFFSDPRAYGKGIKRYAAEFAECPIDMISGEYTPVYLFAPETALRMRRWLPGVKIIACLRNPVERAFSHYRYGLRRRGRLSFYSTFESAVENDPEIVQRGMYGEQLERYYEVFPEKNIKVVMYDDIITIPQSIIQGLYEFVGVSNTTFIPPKMSESINRTSSFEVVERIPVASRSLYLLRHRMQSGGVLERLAVASGAVSLARRVIAANRTRVAAETAGVSSRPEPILQPDTAERLLERYRADGERLRRLLGRDVPWLG